MLAVRVEYLTGRAVATAFDDRREAEWPPHPARLFSAMVAAWAEEDPPSADEKAALEWLEEQDAPLLTASDADTRLALQTFVPVNDSTVVGEPRGEQRLVRQVEQLEVEVAEEEGRDDQAKTEKDRDRHRRQLEKARQRLVKARAELTALRTAALAADPNPPAVAMAMAAQMLPDRRTRQPRYFPSVTPHDPTVWFTWETSPAPNIRSALVGLLGRVTRLGHSSSLVSCVVSDNAPPPTLVPTERGHQILRVPERGQLRRLETDFELHRGLEPRVLPCRFQRYGPPELAPSPAPSSNFAGDWIVLERVGGPRLDSTWTARLATTIRRALQCYAEQPPNPALCGHEADGRPLERPHLAILPLPNVGHAHADGAILGVALNLPASLDDGERASVFSAIASWERKSRQLDADDEAPALRVALGRAGVLELSRVVWGEPRRHTLQSHTWAKRARSWVSATPIALDRNPGDLYSIDSGKAEEAHREAAATIARACINIGLPTPAAVTVLPSITMPGVAKARQFPPFPSEPGKVRRVKVHAVVRFHEPVLGPIVLGAGRFLGMGLMRPFDDGETT